MFHSKLLQLITFIVVVFTCAFVCVCAFNPYVVTHT